MSPPHFNEIAAEICLDGEFVGLIRQEKGDDKREFEIEKGGLYDLDLLIEALIAGRQPLDSMPKSQE